MVILGVYATLPSIILNIYVHVDVFFNKEIQLSGNFLDNLKTINQYYWPLILIFTMAGQFLFFTGGTLLSFSRLHGFSFKKYFRLGPTTPLAPLLGILAGITVVPLASWLGEFWFWLFPSLRVLIEFFGMGDLKLTDPGAIIFNLVVIGVTPAICEEILFRGYLQGTLHRKWSARSSILFAGIMFAMIHQNAFGLTTLILMGILLGWVYYRFQSLYASAALHFAYNSAIVLISMTDFFPGLLDETGNFSLTVTLVSTLAFVLVILGILKVTAKPDQQVLKDEWIQEPPPSQELLMESGTE